MMDIKEFTDLHEIYQQSMSTVQDNETLAESCKDYLDRLVFLFKKFLMEKDTKDTITSLYSIVKDKGVRSVLTTDGLNLIQIIDEYGEYLSDFKEFIQDINDVENSGIDIEKIKEKINSMCISDSEFISGLFELSDINDNYLANMNGESVLSQLELIPMMIDSSSLNSMSDFINKYQISDNEYATYKKRILWVLSNSYTEYISNTLLFFVSMINKSRRDIVYGDTSIQKKPNLQIL